MIEVQKSIEASRGHLRKVLQAAFVSGSVIIGHGCESPDANFTDNGDKRPSTVLTELTEKTKSSGDDFETAYLSYCSRDLKACKTLSKKGLKIEVKIDSLYREQDKRMNFYDAKVVIQYHNHPANILLGKEIAGRETIPKPDNLLTGPSGFIDCAAGEFSKMYEFVLGNSTFISVVREPGGVWLCRPNYEIFKLPDIEKYRLSRLNKELNEWRIKLIEESQFGTADSIAAAIREFTRIAPERFGIEVQFLDNQAAASDFEVKLSSFANRQPLFAPIKTVQ